MNQKTKKIMAGAAGIGLILGLLLFVNSLVGNPVSRLLARNAAEKYIAANYADLELRIEKTSYNFKWGNYMVFARSPESEDTAFGIYFDSFGNALRDDYEYEVANNFTTFRRLDGELRKAAEELIAGGLDYDFDYAAFSFSKDEEDLMKLERDMKLDIHNPPLPLTADVVLFSEDVSYNKIAEAAKALESLLKEQNVPVSHYTVRIIPATDKPEDERQGASWANAISLTDFPADRMDEEDLPLVMEKFETDWMNEMNANDKK